MPDSRETIEAERRRQGGGRPTGRADAPARRRPGSGGTGGGLPPSSGGGGGGGGIGLPGGGGMPSLPGGLPRNLSCGGLILLIILYVVFTQLGGGSPTPQGDQSPAGLPQATLPGESSAGLATPTRKPATATSRPRATLSPGATASGDTWTVMLYQDADDKILEKDIFLDLNEAEKVGSSANVNVVAQIDRYQGGFTGDGDWVSARRYFVTQDNDLQQVSSEVVSDLGEVNMADGRSLVDFVTWAMANYPASKYALILSDHGMGWPGGWSDASARGSGGGIPLASVTGDQIFLNELDDALGTIRNQTGLDKFELVGMDACLMGHLEVLDALAAHARYAITSQETEPALGWAYAAFLSDLAANPGMDGAALGKAIVASYIDEDQRIVDRDQRADLAGAGSLLSSLFGGGSVPSQQQMVDELAPNVTLAAIDLSAIPSVMDRFNDLAFALQDANSRDVAQARSYAQSFTNIFGKQVPASYIDLSHFAQLAGRTSGKASVGQASNALRDAISQAVIAERHGQKKPGATGISIYFPNSDLYRSPEAGLDSYLVAAERFAQDSLWDEYLAFHYTGRAFQRGEQAVTAPERGTTIQAPAAGGIRMTPLQTSQDSVAPGESIRLTSDISGANIGYARLLVGFLDRASNSINVVDTDYLSSPQTRELNGVFYPDWGDQPFTLAFTWEPVVFAINDGSKSTVALFNPESYGASAQQAVYSVEGTYSFSTGEQRYARLYFQDGQLRQVFGFTGSNGEGAPREITPQPGDTFTLREKWLDLDAQGNVSQVAYQEGETLTFGEQAWAWEQLYAAAGDYVVGFIVEDLDGNQQTAYADVTVR